MLISPEHTPPLSQPLQFSDLLNILPPPPIVTFKTSPGVTAKKPDIKPPPPPLDEPSPPPPAPQPFTKISNTPPGTINVPEEP